VVKESKRVNAIIDMRLYDEVMKLGFTISEAITMGLEKLLEPQREEITTSHSIVVPEVLNAKDSLIQSLEVRTNELNTRIESLEDQLKSKENSFQERIQDLKEQLKVKDQQLEKKDIQLENLTNTMQSQAINIHDMLNQKTIEATGNKKPWYKFW
jgi:hypothetical protein